MFLWKIIATPWSTATTQHQVNSVYTFYRQIKSLQCIQSKLLLYDATISNHTVRTRGLVFVRFRRYDETLTVPIIENTPEEKDLKERMALAMEEYPDSCAVLVRRHGVYVWGESWEKAKTMWECILYKTYIQLFQGFYQPCVQSPRIHTCQGRGRRVHKANTTIVVLLQKLDWVQAKEIMQLLKYLDVLLMLVQPLLDISSCLLCHPALKAFTGVALYGSHQSKRCNKVTVDINKPITCRSVSIEAQKAIRHGRVDAQGFRFDEDLKTMHPPQHSICIFDKFVFSALKSE